jgi:hypothetical protein
MQGGWDGLTHLAVPRPSWRIGVVHDTNNTNVYCTNTFVIAFAQAACSVC